MFLVLCYLFILSFYAAHLLDLFYFLQVLADGSDILHIVYVELDVSDKNAVVGFERQTVDVYIHLTGYDFGDGIQDTYAINAFK